MYSTCMFCNHDLGRNQVVEHFPVGRRLAFDAAKGRLWVVCRRCERWNLTPIEERWEAIEECEDLFHGIRTRASTDNIGLARHREGTELVRIGEPMRPEFAAWRYGDQFGRRRRNAILVGVGAGAVLGTVAIAGLATGVVSGALLSQSGNFVNILRAARTVARVPDEGGRILKLKATHLDTARILPPEGGEGWTLEVKRGRLNQRWEGPEAVRMAGRILPAINRTGAQKSAVQEAVREIEEAGHPEELLRRLSPELDREEGSLWRRPVGHRHWKPGKEKPTGYIRKLPHPTRLALEMALHEEQERRALQGELGALAFAWKQAEEIAAIADDLLLPEGTQEFMEKHRTDPR
jgi:hypothetical protein